MAEPSLATLQGMMQYLLDQHHRMAGDVVEIKQRLDRHEALLEQIERRLLIVDANKTMSPI